MSIRIPLVAGCLLLASVALADDWPSFRGPNRDGICKETGLLQQWPKDGPPKVWTAKDLGLGFGTPSVGDGKIFGIGSRNGKDGVWALNEADGKELWFTELDPTAKVAPNTNGPSSTPTLHKGKVYTVSLGGLLACMDAKDGKLLWTKNYLKDFGGRLPTWGFAESVLGDGDAIICAPGGPEAAVVALKADSGDVIWKTKLGAVGGGAGYSSPMKATVAGTPMYLVELGQSSGLVGLSLADGKLLWQYKGTAATGGVAQIPIPIVKDDLVWVSTGYNGGAALLQIVPEGEGKFTVKELKAYPAGQLKNHHGGMVQVGDHLYFGHDQNQGYPVCVEFKTGKIVWGPEKNANLYGGGKNSAAVLYADGRAYFRYQNGIMVLIDPSPEELKVVSSFKLPPPNANKTESWPHPVIANGKLYIRDQNMLYCYNVKAEKN